MVSRGDVVMLMLVTLVTLVMVTLVTVVKRGGTCDAVWPCMTTSER